MITICTDINKGMKGSNYKLPNPLNNEISVKSINEFDYLSSAHGDRVITRTYRFI